MPRQSPAPVRCASAKTRDQRRLGGTVLKSMGYISVLSDNIPVEVIYHGIGIGSCLVWFWLAIKTKLRGIEIAREITGLVAAEKPVMELRKVVDRVPTREKDGRKHEARFHGLSAATAANDQTN